MQKIDKSQFQAIAFAEELAEYRFENGGKDWRYEASNAHYKSVFMALFICQKGLCAYTEKRLGNLSDIERLDSWDNGYYIGAILPAAICADIDHYESAMKVMFGWEVDNLFLCHVHQNRKIKLSKPVHYFFKPDNDEYSPDVYLHYDFDTHHFVPKPDLAIASKEIYDQVSNMILALGMNAYSVKCDRENMLLKYKDRITSKRATIAEIADEVSEFFTAFNMSLTILQGL